MKQSLFIDTNVLLDIVLNRDEFIKDAKAILLLRASNHVELFTSALSISHCAYFAKKSRKEPTVVVGMLLRWFSVIDLKREHLESSLLSNFVDFEDGLQYFAAKEIKGIDYIITRNAPDFKSSMIPVVSPSEFLAFSQP